VFDPAEGVRASRYSATMQTITGPNNNWLTYWFKTFLRVAACLLVGLPMVRLKPAFERVVTNSIAAIQCSE
jgi:hypothetical protein